MAFTCSVGKFTQSHCSPGVPLPAKCLQDPRQVYLLQLRSGCGELKSICERHREVYWFKYAVSQRQCCDPFLAHKKKGSIVKNGLRPVTAVWHDACVAASRFPQVIEGRKVCTRCRTQLFKELDLSTARKGENASGNRSKTVPSPVTPTQKSPGRPMPGAPGFFETPEAHHAQGHVASRSAAVVTGRKSARRRLIQPAEPRAARGVCVAGSSSASETGSTASSNSHFSPKKAVVERLNQSLQILGGSPVDSKKLGKSQKYLNTKLCSSKNLLKETLVRVAGNCPEGTEADTVIDYEEAGKEMIKQVMDQLTLTQSYAKKIQILTVLPRSFSAHKICKTFQKFGVTMHMAKVTKALVAQYGILATPNPRRGRPLPAEVEELIINFYQEPNVSRFCAGKKECLSVKGVMQQKRLILGNLRDIYESFQTKHQDKQVGFSKFASLRPRHCVLAGSAGTHTVCVCTTHQNNKLMFLGAHFGALKLRNGEKVFNNYHECVTATMCSQPTEDCHFGLCVRCPGTDFVQRNLGLLLSDNFVEEVTFKQWTKDAKGRYNLSTFLLSCDEFVEAYIQSLPELRQHDYTAKQQADFFKQRRDSLKPGEVLVVADFSENYSFIVQDSIQSVYWNNKQATVHPFAIYYRDPISNEIVSTNLVVLSDHMKHVTATVSKFQEVLIEHLKEKIPQPLTKIIYFSDGCSGQYKNRYNMKNLLMHSHDNGIAAEWHFFATSHGKGPSDGLGGTLKRLATRASLQRPLNDQIQTPKDLYLWAKGSLKGINCAFVDSRDVELHAKKLKLRFPEAPSLHGIRSHHAVLPVGTNSLEMKILSTSATGRTVQLLDGHADPESDGSGEDLAAPNTRASARRTARKSLQRKQ